MIQVFKAWAYYCYTREDGFKFKPIQGTVVKSNEWAEAFFVKEGDPVDYGRVVSGEEGVALDYIVWFRYKATKEEVKEAVLAELRYKIDQAEHDIKFYKNELKVYGAEEEEEGAE